MGKRLGASWYRLVESLGFVAMGILADVILR